VPKLAAKPMEKHEDKSEITDGSSYSQRALAMVSRQRLKSVIGSDPCLAV
jgi:hypothetical protein